MKITIGFSVFESPSKPYGQIYGNLNVQEMPSVGEDMDIVPDSNEPNILGLHKMTVREVIAPDATRPQVIVILNDVIAEGHEDARNIASILEERHGFIASPYCED